MFVRGILAGGAASLFALAAVAEASSIGPQVGAPAPVSEVVTAQGETVSLSDLSGEAGVAVAFVRSLDWCPYCRQQAIELEGAKAPLAASGWALTVLSYDPPETLTAFAEEKGLTYTLVSDEGSDAIRAFDLFNEEMREGSRYWGIPHPAIVFIDTAGMVGEVLREEGYKDRPPVDVVIEAAERLRQTGAG